MKLLGWCKNCYHDIYEGDHMDCCGNLDLQPVEEPTMKRKVAILPKGQIRVTTTRVVETDMQVAREFFQLLGDAPAKVSEFAKNVLLEINNFDPDADI